MDPEGTVRHDASWLRTPFGDGYRVLAHAYRAQLSPESLRSVLRPQVQKSKQLWTTSVAKAHEESSGNLVATAQKLLHGRLSRVVLWDILAVLFRGLAVFWLGLVVQELELGTAWGGLLAAQGHSALRYVPLALLVFLSKIFQQFAKHRSVKIAEQATCALSAFLFRGAAPAGGAGCLGPRLAAVPEVVRAVAKRARPRLWSPALGLILGALCSWPLGPLALLLLVMQLGMLALEVLLRQRMALRWLHRAVELRRQREAMSPAILALEMGCASSTVKLQSWESSAFQRLQLLRSAELKALRKAARLEAMASAVSELAVFVPLALVLLLQWMAFGRPTLWLCFQAWAASRMTCEQMRHLGQVLLTKVPEVKEPDPEPKEPKEAKETSIPKQGDRNSYKAARYAVVIDGMRFFWHAEASITKAPSKGGNAAMQAVMQKAEKAKGNSLQLVDSVSDDASVAERARRSAAGSRFDLKVLSLQVKRGSHVGLVGATKSGKSTLLAGLVGGCRSEHWGEDLDGGILLSGRLAYAPQEPSLLAACSVRENVLCGRPWDSARYDQALMVSTLSEDLLGLSDGDMVEELPGVGLAAMQLARAFYAEAQILLLDDPFVLMDPDRQKRALSGLVKAKDRTILLATQNLSLLSLMDNIIVLRNGTVFEQGDYKTLSSMPTEFSRMLLISNEKETRRQQHQRDGIPCPFLCYEVGPDPLQELYPWDEQFGTFPAFGQKLRSPKRWVSVDHQASAPTPPVSSLSPKKTAKPAPPMDAFRCDDVDELGASGSLTNSPFKKPRDSVSSKSTSHLAGDTPRDAPERKQGPSGPSLTEVEEDAEEQDLFQMEDGEGAPPAKVRRALPSASAVPMVGASEAAYGAGAGERPASPTSPEVPMDGSIPVPRSSEMALSDKLRQQEASPSSPDSADGLRRRVPAGDVEAFPVVQHVRPEVQHAAPAPQTLGRPRDEDRVKRRRAEKEEREAPSRSRVDLERSLKEKNDKIAELEKQVAKAGRYEKKELLRSGSSSSFLEGRFARAGNGLNFSALRQKGQSRSVLLLGSGIASWFLVLLVLLGTGLHLAVPVLLSYLFVPVVFSTSAATAPSPPGGITSSASSTTHGTSPGNSITTAGPPVPTFPDNVVVDDSEVLWRGFATTSAASSAATTTATVTMATTASSQEVVVSEAWTVKLPGHFCHEPNLAQETRPEGSFELDPTVGWHWATLLSLVQCQKVCQDLPFWPCRFISWGGPVSDTRWCYVHQQCPDVMRVAVYEILELPEASGARRLQATRPNAGSFRPARSSTTSEGLSESNAAPGAFSGSFSRRLQADDAQSEFSMTSLEAIFAGLCILLPIVTVVQARVAAEVALKASDRCFSRHLRSLLAAPCREFGKGACTSVCEGNMFLELQKEVASRRPGAVHHYLKDVVDADDFLPKSLVPSLAAFTEVLAAIICAAAASGRQAVQAVSLTLAAGLSVYLHRMRLPVLHQLRRFVAATDEAAALRVRHLMECHEVLRVHGRISTLCDDYEALCHDREMASIAADAAERWLYTRLHCLVSLLLGLFCFSLFTEAPTALPAHLGLAVSLSAVVQVALLPDALIELLKNGGRLSYGLAALRRLHQLVKETMPEELESPVLKLKAGEVEKGPSPGVDKTKGRSGKIALGDIMVDHQTEEVLKTKEEQFFSVAGYPIDKVPLDWPYFGAVDVEDVTIRYSTDLSPALSECSLRLPAGEAMLLVGGSGCGKTTLLRSFLRLVPSETGRVLLDGIDTRSVGLSTLRGRVALVPQEIVLYRGTWRQNLDPMGEFTEDELQMVLRLTRFENWMKRHTSEGLDQQIDEANPAFPSAGVLLGLSRAVLKILQKRSKLLLLDATTCRLSPSSDADLTALVLRYCRRCACAVLQVSRRVQQAPLYDEVAVMAAGRVTEQGPAKKLWVKDGALRRMAKEQGLDSSKMTKAEALSIRLSSVRAWEVSPQENPAWQEEFSVSMKKVKG